MRQVTGLTALAFLFLAQLSHAGIIRQDVRSFSKSGSTGLIGAVTISEGSGISLVQSGQDISISATASGSSVPVILVTSSATSITSATDIVWVSGSNIQTLSDCTGLSSNHLWKFLNIGTGIITIQAGGANTITYGGVSDTALTLSDPGTGIEIQCNKGSAMYAF